MDGPVFHEPLFRDIVLNKDTAHLWGPIVQEELGTFDDLSSKTFGVATRKLCNRTSLTLEEKCTQSLAMW